MVYLLLADGFEETEAVAPLDVLRRAEIKVRTVGVTGDMVTGAHGIKMQADLAMEQIDTDTMTGIILPGGMPGTLNLQKDARVTELLKTAAAQDKLIAAICAAPMILGGLGLLEGRRATCFPGFEEELHGAQVEDSGVVTDGSFITGRGAGVALQFGAAIVDYFIPDSLKGGQILRQMQCRL